MGRWGDAWSVLTGKSHAMGLQTFSNWIRAEAGPRKNQSEALAAYKSSPRFRAVVEKVAQSVALNPWQVFLTRPGVSATHLRASMLADLGDPITFRKRIQGLTKAGYGRSVADVVPLAETEPDHAFLQFMRRPNQSLRWYGTVQTVQTNLDIVGRILFWLKERDSKGRPTEILPIPVTMVSATTQDGVQISFRGQVVNVPVEDLLVLHQPSPSDPYDYSQNVGLGMALSDELDTDENAAKTTNARLRNHGVPDSVVTVVGAGDNEVKAIESHVLSMYQGPSKRGHPHFTNREVQIQHIAEKLADMSITELRKFEAQVIWTTFGVPPAIMGLVEDVNRANAETSERLYGRWVLLPRLTFLGDFLQHEIAPLYDANDRILVLPMSPVPEDKEARHDLLTVAPWAPEANEVRSWLDLQPKPELEGLHYVPGSGSFVQGAQLKQGPQSEPAGPGSDEGDEDSDADEDPEPETDDERSETEDAKAFKQQGVSDETKVERITAALRPERLTLAVERLWRSELQAWMLRSGTEVGASLSLDMINPLIAAHMRAFGGERIVGINRTTQNAIREALAAGIEAGEGADVLARRVRDVFSDANTRRALVIARTEVLRSSNWAATAAYRASGLVEEREWLATPDTRTRDSHRDMDGQTIGIGERFQLASGVNRGREADHPGGFDIPAEDIQCRCFTAPKVNRRSTEDRQKKWEELDAEATRWEESAATAFRVGFAQQSGEIEELVQQYFGKE